MELFQVKAKDKAKMKQMGVGRGAAMVPRVGQLHLGKTSMR